MIVMVMMTAFHNLGAMTWQHELLRKAKLMSMDVMCWCFGDVTIIISLKSLGCQLMSLWSIPSKVTSYSEDVSRVQGPCGSIWILRPQSNQSSVSPRRVFFVESPKHLGIPTVAWGWRNGFRIAKKRGLFGRHHKRSLWDHWYSWQVRSVLESPADQKAGIRPTKICSFSRHFEGPAIQAITIIWF